MGGSSEIQKQPEYSNILTRYLGDSYNIKILGFFVEHPFTAYRISYISRRLNISRVTTRRHLLFYLESGYLTRAGKRGSFSLQINAPVVKAIHRWIHFIGEEQYIQDQVGEFKHQVLELAEPTCFPRKDKTVSDIELASAA